MTYSIVPIVEGHSEVESVPLLIRRLAAEWGEYGFRVEKPVRVKRYQVIKNGELERRLQLALRRPDCAAIIIILDADDDCPRELASDLLKRAKKIASDVVISVVIPKSEFESWFVGSIESLKGCHSISDTAVTPVNPEDIRDAKGFLTNKMTENNHYLEVDDQPAMTATFDMTLAYTHCRSFKKFHNDLCKIITTISSLAEE
jgi:hypothetical protein